MTPLQDLVDIVKILAAKVEMQQTYIELLEKKIKLNSDSIDKTLRVLSGKPLWNADKT